MPTTTVRRPTVGHSAPLGATVSPRGVNFSVFSNWHVVVPASPIPGLVYRAGARSAVVLFADLV